MEVDMLKHEKDLPPISLNSTTIPYLVTLIPVLVSMTKRGAVPCYGNEADKPAWWPDDVKWRNPKFYTNLPVKDSLSVLRRLVHSCYSYHGLEDLLNMLDETPASQAKTENAYQQDAIIITDDVDEETNDSTTDMERPVFVCCFCLEQFFSHDSVIGHQNFCKMRFKDQASVSVRQSCSPNQSPRKDGTQGLKAGKSQNANVSRFDNSPPTITKPHEQEMKGVAPLENSSSASSLFVPTLKTRSQKKLDQIMERHNQKRLMLKECLAMASLPTGGAWWMEKRKIFETPSHPNSYLSADAFMSALSLIKKTELEARMKEGCKQEVDLDCQIISVEGPLSAVPSVTFEKPSLTSPRSSRSLMSQLSRDNDAHSRRRLSFCFVEDEWADKEALEEGRDPLQMSLLTLDLSSPLGQRIKKYVKGEGHLNIIKDPEAYSRTEVDEDSYSKLRYRATDFRVTFKKKKRASTFVHKYKFNKADKHNFKMLLKTGLNARSRHLKQSLPVCKVTLKKLFESEIKKWTEEKKISIAQHIVFDDDICITQIDIPQSKLTQGFPAETSNTQLHCSSHLSTQLTQSPQHKPKFATSRPSLSNSLPPSPPHVPNIFRNRSPYASSPTRPGPKSVQLKLARALDFSNLGPEPPRLTSRAPVQFEPHVRPMQHLSRHPSQSPSVYAQRHSFPTTQRRPMGPASRRKQLMTSVRRDDFEGSVSHNGGHNIGFIHMDGNDPCVVSNPGGIAGAMKNGQSKNFRRLSNFDYFSIRNGQLHPPHPSPDLSISPGRAGRSITATSQANHEKQLYHRSHSSRPSSMPQRPAPKQALPPGAHINTHNPSNVRPPTVVRQSTAVRQPTTIRPPGVNIPTSQPFENHQLCTLPPLSKLSPTSPSQHRPVVKQTTGTDPQTANNKWPATGARSRSVKDATNQHLAGHVPKPSSWTKSIKNMCPALEGEDDILEVICIDDD